MDDDQIVFVLSFSFYKTIDTKNQVEFQAGGAGKSMNGVLLLYLKYIYIVYEDYKEKLKKNYSGFTFPPPEPVYSGKTASVILQVK